MADLNATKLETADRAKESLQLMAFSSTRRAEMRKARRLMEQAYLALLQNG